MWSQGWAATYVWSCRSACSRFKIVRYVTICMIFSYLSRSRSLCLFVLERSSLCIYGWLSKLWSLFGSLIYSTAPNIQDTPKGTIILTTTHMFMQMDLEIPTPQFPISLKITRLGFKIGFRVQGLGLREFPEAQLEAPSYQHLTLSIQAIVSITDASGEKMGNTAISNSKIKANDTIYPKP